MNMKKKFIIILSVATIFLIGIIIWFNRPMDLMDVEPHEVKEIVVFNGNTGRTTHIDTQEHIQHIVENLNDVQVKRTKPSVGYSGFGFNLTIRSVTDKETTGWHHFIINAEDTVRKDPFFYTVTRGTIDYSYIENIVA